MSKEDKKLLIKSNFCRSFLYFSGFITDSENEKIHNRIKKFQDKKKISVTREQLDSVDILCKLD